MNEQELAAYLAGRKPSPHVAQLDVAALHCYGCAHSAASMPPPSAPSGERPCCSCVRNPERDEWGKDRDHTTPVLRTGSDGHARCFDPFAGTLYNGAPRPYLPSDNYVTMDQRDQEQFLDAHPEYAGAVDGAGDPVQPAWVTQLCTVPAEGHGDTCNGLPRPDCPGYSAWLAAQ